MKDLREKVILITGAGQGLGEATAKTLADAGAIIIGGDVKDTQVKQVAEKIVRKGGRVEGIKLDVTNDSDIEKGIADILAKYGKLDILINNAGIDITKSIEEIESDEFDRVIKVNLRAPFILSKKAFAVMKKRGGHIINIASTAARRAWANASAYHASKWGLLGMSHALHVEGREHNIKVSAVVAGGMRTPFILERFPETPIDVLQDPENVAEVIKFILLLPEGTVIPEVMVLPIKETSWP